MDNRYWILDSANEANRLNAVNMALNMRTGEHQVVAIVDDESGIIAYASLSNAKRIVNALNLHEEVVTQAASLLAEPNDHLKWDALLRGDDAPGWPVNDYEREAARFPDFESDTDD